MSQSDLGWTPHVMRAGYAGRGLVYCVVAGVSIWAMTRGGSAQGTSSAMAVIEQSAWGKVVLGLVALGMAAYAIWRWICATYDLEAYGNDGKGLVARAGQITTGTIHLAIGFAVATILFSGGGGGGGSKVAEYAGKVMSMPGGVWIVGIAGLLTCAAGAYYAKKAIAEDYQDNLRSNGITSKLDPVLKAGVLAQGIIVFIIGAFLLVAALRHDPSQAGGTAKAFEWLYNQPFGQVLVGIICVGLLCFAAFCFVNAAFRVIPKVADDEIITMADEAARKSLA